jgi:hypothetical protein
MSKLLTLLAMTSALTATAADKEARVYEMRTYTASPGKMEALHQRFRDHTVKLFAKHGIEQIGYWVPMDAPESKLIFVLGYASRAAREQAWKSFLADPQWQAAFKESEKNGSLVAKVENPFLIATDYSPAIKVGPVKNPRAFELRTYTASPGNLGHLNARFRDHTVALFAKHGMTNLAYWNLMPDQKGAAETLVYLLAHESREAAAKSFKGFREDPAWMKARTESEQKAGGSLTAAKNGVVSLFLKPTDYSPTK